MRFLKYSLIALLTLMLLSSAGYLIAASGMQSKPGFAKIDLPSWLSTNTIVALNLGPKGLKSVRWVVKRLINESKHDLDLSERLILTVMLDLQGLKLRIYQVEDDRPVFDTAIDTAIGTLKQANWRTLLSIREKQKRIVVMQAGDDDMISGFSVLASTPENAFFINLVGQLTTESIVIIADSLAASK